MTEKQSLFLQEHWCGLNWSSWVSFASSSQDFRQFAAIQGLYRVRIESQETLAYIGQTGRSLRERVRTLANKTQQDSSPWNDPHTAAACLWAWKKEEAVSYSVSVAVTALSTVDRQCLEDLLLFRYRQEKGRSTLANHGHFHPKWIRPSSKSKGRSMQKRLSPVEEVRSLSPPKIRKETTDPFLYLDIPWSESFLLRNPPQKFQNVGGVYRIVSENMPIYFGESKDIYARLQTHAKNFVGANLQVSVIEMPKANAVHRKERETDIIGAFYEQQGFAPQKQYGT